MTATHVPYVVYVTNQSDTWLFTTEACKNCQGLAPDRHRGQGQGMLFEVAQIVTELHILGAGEIGEHHHRASCVSFPDKGG